MQIPIEKALPAGVNILSDESLIALERARRRGATIEERHVRKPERLAAASPDDRDR